MTITIDLAPEAEAHLQQRATRKWIQQSFEPWMGRFLING